MSKDQCRRSMRPYTRLDTQPYAQLSRTASPAAKHATAHPPRAAAERMAEEVQISRE
jgi:hypothetical protein